MATTKAEPCLGPYYHQQRQIISVLMYVQWFLPLDTEILYFLEFILIIPLYLPNASSVTAFPAYLFMSFFES